MHQPLASATHVGNVSAAVFDRVVREWSDVVGADHVLTATEARDRYSRSSSAGGTRPLAIVKPRLSTEVQAIIRIAADFRIPLYPISRGRNWGYGDACAVTDGQVILDLGRMNRIHEVNVPLAYAVIEPGVTQQQLFEHLRDRNDPLWLDVTGAGPDASVLGNTLERGFGHTPYGDHFHASAGYDVVMADGRLLRTGFGHYANSKTNYAFKAGLGPALDGIFTQSNFGIVVRMGVWLMPKPKYLQGFAFSVPKDEDIGPVIDRLRALRMAGVVNSAVHVANDLRVLSSRRHYPYELTSGVTPIPDAVRLQMRKDAALGAWNALGGLYGTKSTVAAARAIVRRKFQGLAKLHFIDDDTLALGEKICQWTNRFGIGRNLAKRLSAIRPAFALLKGEPDVQHLYGAGWRSRKTESTSTKNDPLEENWGLSWVAPVLPMTGEAALDYMRLIEPIFQRFAFEPLVTMTAITPRAACAVTTIAFDRTNPGEAERAAECQRELLRRCIERGYAPYRCGIQNMEAVTEGPSVFWDAVRSIKHALDPSNILAPGRYSPT